MSKAFRNIGFLTFIGLTVSLILVYYLTAQIGIRKPVLLKDEVNGIGIKGPISFQFFDEMDFHTVENAWTIFPQTSGRFKWEGRTMWFFPTQALQETNYTVQILGGIKTRDGNISELTWSWDFVPRTPEIIYIHPVRTTSELWKSNLEGDKKIQLTHTGGKIKEFAPSFDGQVIVYTVINSLGGIDIHQVNRDGRNEKMLLECGKDQCVQPAWSVDSDKIAYSRIPGIVNPNSMLSARLFTVDVRTGISSQLFISDEISGQYPSWSPDGKRLAFYDSNLGAIRVLDLKNSKIFTLPNSHSMFGSWSGDGSRYIFLAGGPQGVDASSDIYEADFTNNSIKILWEVALHQLDYGVPEISPDSQWLVAGLRLPGGSYSRQLWLLKYDGSEQINFSNEYSHTHAAYKWSPNGNQIIYQKYSLNTSSAVPEIILWNRKTGIKSIIQKNASLPAWIP